MSRLEPPLRLLATAGYPPALACDNTVSAVMGLCYLLWARAGCRRPVLAMSVEMAMVDMMTWQGRHSIPVSNFQLVKNAKEN